MMPPAPMDMGDFAMPPGTPETAEAWAERRRRQRSVRMFMMMLMMLLLMDGDERPSSQRHGDPNHNLRLSAAQQLASKRKKSRDRLNAGFEKLESEVWSKRRKEDANVKEITNVHERKIDRSKKVSVEGVEDSLVQHYPRNVTGYYQGRWERRPFVPQQQKDESEDEEGDKTEDEKKEIALRLSKKEMDLLKQKDEQIGVFLLSPGMQLSTIKKKVEDSQDTIEEEEYSESRNLIFTKIGDEKESDKKNGTTVPANFHNMNNRVNLPPSSPTTLNEPKGKVGLRFFMKSIPGISQFSLVDGFVKLSDSSSFTTRRDWMLRARGVILHDIGRVSLVGNSKVGRSIFYVGESENNDGKINKNKRRLEEKGNWLEDLEKEDMDEDMLSAIRDMALSNKEWWVDANNNNLDSWKSLFSSEDFNEVERPIILDGIDNEKGDEIDTDRASIFPRGLEVEGRLQKNIVNAADISIDTNTSTNATSPLPESVLIPTSRNTEAVMTSPQSKPFLNPYPYVFEDKNKMQQNELASPHSISIRDQALFSNTAKCEFEINFDVSPSFVSSSVLQQISKHVQLLLKYAKPQLPSSESESADLPTLNKETLQNSLVKEIVGTILSPNCDFSANITATALRIDWETTTGKAINYSFYMMLTCLTQIVVLLRQLLHTQSQGAASRVSLLCIGWQTILDAVLCIVHIYLCLSMQPLFTAFASVAFFKLLIFCVIEMKYMAIILQARNNADDSNLTARAAAERLRQQVTLLHMVFYAALFSTLLGFYHLCQNHLSACIWALYSFWTPQIFTNVVTEARRPLHPHYIYGMSVTRLVAPLYVFACRGTFLREANPAFPLERSMCGLLVLWVGVQAGLLILQGKYGARFMIPARFLPPKFDYSRQIPSSMVPLPTPPPQPTTTDTDPTTTEGTRHRGISNRTRSSSSPSSTRTTTSENTSDNTLDCVICYSPIDISNRKKYMLAPCDHIFHRECLEQWMDVKMECPICRTNLPPI